MLNKVNATIGFSAQFGGRDAATSALPHFKALKAVAGNYSLSQFPYKAMEFVLRVDGEVNSFNLSGPGFLDFDGDNYVSVDIGIQRKDYELSSDQLIQAVVTALQSSAEFMKNSKDKRLREIDYQELEKVLTGLSISYKEKMELPGL